MADKKDKLVETKEEKLLGKISSFASANRKWILIGLIALVVILIALVIITTSANKRDIKKFEQVAAYEDQLEEMVLSEDSALVNEYLADVEKGIKGSSYVSVKSAYILGEYYAAKGDWATAYDYFMKAYNLNSKIYLSTVAVLNAAVCEDEQGHTDKALALYQQVVDADDMLLTAKALFNVGRIYFEQSNVELAKVTFQQLVDSYSYSEYAKIAENIISVM